MFRKILIATCILLLILTGIVFWSNVSTPKSVEEPFNSPIHDVLYEEPIIASEIQQEPVKTQINAPDTNYPRTLTKSGGVYYEECGLVEKWYSSQRLPHYKMSEWVVDDNGFWRKYQDGIWYFVVAYTMSVEIGTPINISMGPALVLDHCETEGVVDVYVNW